MRTPTRTLLAATVGVAAVLATAVVASPPRSQAASPRHSDPDEALARSVCSHCHAFPPPDSLPRRNWGTVAYEMAGLMIGGIGAPRGLPPPSIDFDVDRVIRYYESRAPRSLASPEPWPAPEAGPGRFSRRSFRPSGTSASPSVSNVAFHDLDGKGRPRIVATDMVAGLVLGGDPALAAAGLEVLGRVPNPARSTAVDLDGDGRTDLVVADLGDVPPGDHAKGTVTWLRRGATGAFEAVVLAAGLPRVADVQAGDFDSDGDLDLVVAAFGWRETGGIWLLENRTRDWSEPSFLPRQVDDRPGAINVPVADLDGDGRLDFVALLAQHVEAVVAFLGDGRGGFRRQTIDEAPHPAWGSSGLSLVDFDGDGDLDGLVTNGDMLDDFLLKPYHGIRWLENRGGFPFVPHSLANLPGVHGAQAVDLDGDGDLDVVACAFVFFGRDGGRPQAVADQPSLVWLERTGPGRFARHTLEMGAQHVSLDVADYDRDGDMDIVVGNFRGGRAWVEVWEGTTARPREAFRTRRGCGRPRRSSPAPPWGEQVLVVPGAETTSHVDAEY